MNNSHRTSRGQVLIIFVFAIVGLIGMTGLAIDGGNIYSDRRHAQNAADTAALAAALKRTTWMKGPPYQPAGCSDFNTETGLLPPCSAPIIKAAMDMAAQNGYDSNPDHQNRVDVYSPPIDPPYSQFSYRYDRRDYIEVVIKDDVDTWFAKVLGIGQLHNRVHAVVQAMYQPKSKLYGGNSLVELRPTSGPGCGSLAGGGGGDVYLGGSSGMILDGGGIFVNSDNPDCALKITNTCPSIQLRNGATVQGMGGQFPGCTPPLLNPATEAYPYPPLGSPVDPIPPAACNAPINTTPGIWNPTDNTFHFPPGHYLKLPPDKDTTLDPGVYCVDNLIKTTNSFTFKADGVFMYVKPGGAFNFQGGTIQLVAPGMIFPGKTTPAPVAPATEPYRGYLIYVDESNWTGTALNCVVNGASDTVLRGVIYAPHCDVTINGGSGTFGITAQVIAYTLNLTGDAVLNFTYEADKMPGEPEKNLIGISR